MKNLVLFFRSFYVKVALSFILSLLFVALLGNYILLEFSLQSQFSQLREKLKVIAQTAALSINTADLAAVPLEPSGVNSPVFQKISDSCRG